MIDETVSNSAVERDQGEDDGREGCDPPMIGRKRRLLEADEEVTGGRRAKKARDDRVIKERDAEGQDFEAVIERSHGQIFSGTIAQGSARVHYGNVYNIHRGESSGSSATASTQVALPADLAVRGVRAIMLTVLCRRIMEEILTYILSLVACLNINKRSIPAQIQDNTTIFEDAFGRVSRIDIDVIPNWAAFGSLLVGKFEGLRGLQRVRNGKYRLHNDDAQTFVDTRAPRHFHALFRRGGHVRMSIYFDHHEVSSEACPRCATRQTSLPGRATVCTVCQFTFISEPSKVCMGRDKTSILSLVTFEPSVDDQDKPEHFIRISVGGRRVSRPTQALADADKAPSSPPRSSHSTLHDYSGDAASALPSTMRATPMDESSALLAWADTFELLGPEEFHVYSGESDMPEHTADWMLSAGLAASRPPRGPGGNELQLFPSVSDYTSWNHSGHQNGSQLLETYTRVLETNFYPVRPIGSGIDEFEAWLPEAEPTMPQPETPAFMASTLPPALLEQYRALRDFDWTPSPLWDRQDEGNLYDHSYCEASDGVEYYAEATRVTDADGIVNSIEVD